MSPVAELDEVLAQWAAGSLMTDPSAVRLGDVARSFAERLAMAGRCSWADATAQDCEVFVRSATRRGRRPAPGTMFVRRSALRAVYRTLKVTGAVQGDPTAGLVLPPRSVRTARPLADDEVALLRVTAEGRTRVLVALCGAGATTCEATTVTAEHLTTSRGRRLLTLPGVARVTARTVELDAWTAAVLDTSRPDEGGPLWTAGDSAPASQGAQAAVCNTLRRLYADCGFGDADVRPVSLRLHAAAAAHRATGRIEDAARLLGVAGLDAAADAIHWDWRQAGPGHDPDQEDEAP